MEMEWRCWEKLHLSGASVCFWESLMGVQSCCLAGLYVIVGADSAGLEIPGATSGELGRGVMGTLSQGSHRTGASTEIGHMLRTHD